MISLVRLLEYIGVAALLAVALVWAIRYRLLPPSALPDDDSGSDIDGGMSRVPAPLRPKPHRKTGTVAMEEPDND